MCLCVCIIYLHLECVPLGVSGSQLLIEHLEVAETPLISCPGVLYPKAARVLTAERMSSMDPELPGPGAIQ